MMISVKAAFRSGGIRRFVVRGTVTSLIAIIAVKSLGLLESIAVGRILGSYQYGLLALVLSVTNLVLAIGTFGLPAALIKFLSGNVRRKEAAKGTILLAFRTCTVTSILVGASSVIIVMNLVEPNYADGNLQTLLGLGILMVTVSAPLALFGSALQGLGRVAALNLRTMLASAIGFALAVPLALVLGTPGALAAFIGGTALVGVLSFPAVRNNVEALDGAPEVASVPLKALIDYGVPTLFSGLVVLFAFYWVNSLMATGPGFADLGVFAVASTLASGIALLPSSVGIPLVPVLSSLSLSDPGRGQAVVSRVMRLVIFISVPIVVVGICFAREIIELTYGHEFVEGSPFLSILALSSLFVAVSGVVGNQIAGVGKMWWSLTINLIWSGIVGIVSFALIPRFGGAGASVAILTGYSILTVVAMAVGRRVLEVRLDSVGGPAMWGASFVVCALIAAFFGGEWRVLAGASLFTLALISLAFLLNPDERSLVKELPVILGIKRKPR